MFLILRLKSKPAVPIIGALVVLGGELAVPYTRNPLDAGLNSRPRVPNRIYRAILIGHRATDGHEPRQVRKEAAISDAVCVAD